MHTTNYELFESFDYIENDQLEELLFLTKQMYEENFKGFQGTSFGTQKKDVLTFCLIYSFLEKPCPINNLIWAMCSYQEEFFQNTLVHLENMSCIKTKNLIPYFAVSAKNFSNKFLKNNIDFKLMETKEWISDFLSSYNEEILNYNLDTENSKYIDKFLEIEKRIVNMKLENNLPLKMYDVKKRKI